MYGIIDIGSNTMRLSCYRVVDKTLISVFHKKVMAGLAGYVDDKKCLSKEGIDIAVKTLEDFKKIIMCVGLDNLYVIATASFRNVNNTDDIVKEIKKKTGICVRVLSGKEEALYDFKGATYNKQLDAGLVVDIGGGSTELVPFKGNDAKKAVSLPFGSLNLFSKYVIDLFPSKEEEQKIRDCVKKELSKQNIDKEKDILGVGGSNRACLRLYNNYYGYNRNNTEMKCDKIHEMLTAFCDDEKNEMKKILKIVPDRIHTIIPGMIVLDEISHYYKCKKVQISDWGVREGFMVEKLL